MSNKENLDKTQFNNIDQIKQNYLKIRENLEQKDVMWQKLVQIIQDISLQEKKEYSLPIDTKTGRIDMEQYHVNNEKPYSLEVKEGIEETIREYEEKWYQNLLNNKIDLEDYAESTLKGEKAELFVLENLYKFLSDNFIIVRSSRYDDIDNGVDTIILDKDTGNIICAFDEASTFSPHFEEKKGKVLYKNLHGGTRLKYGLKLEQQKGNINIKGSPIMNIPVFYLPIDINETEKELLKQIDKYDLKTVNDEDHIIFRYLITIINEQVKQMSEFNLSNSPSDIKIPEDIYNKAHKFIEKILKLYPNILYQESPNIVYKKGNLKPEFYTLKQKLSPPEIDKFRNK